MKQQKKEREKERKRERKKERDRDFSAGETKNFLIKISKKLKQNPRGDKLRINGFILLGSV